MEVRGYENSGFCTVLFYFSSGVFGRMIGEGVFCLSSKLKEAMLLFIDWKQCMQNLRKHFCHLPHLRYVCYSGSIDCILTMKMIMLQAIALWVVPMKFNVTTHPTVYFCYILLSHCLLLWILDSNTVFCLLVMNIQRPCLAQRFWSLETDPLKSTVMLTLVPSWLPQIIRSLAHWFINMLSIDSENGFNRSIFAM